MAEILIILDLNNKQKEKNVLLTKWLKTQPNYMRNHPKSKRP